MPETAPVMMPTFASGQRVHHRRISFSVAGVRWNRFHVNRTGGFFVAGLIGMTESPRCRYSSAASAVVIELTSRRPVRAHGASSRGQSHRAWQSRADAQA